VECRVITLDGLSFIPKGDLGHGFNSRRSLFLFFEARYLQKMCTSLVLSKENKKISTNEKETTVRMNEKELRKELTEFSNREKITKEMEKKYLLEFENEKKKLKDILNLRPKWYCHLSPELKKDFEIITLCTRKTSLIFKYLPLEYQRDPQFILENVKSPPFHLLHSSLKENKEIMKKIIRIHPKYLNQTNLIFEDDFYVELLEKHFWVFDLMIDHPRRFQYKFIKAIISPKSSSYLRTLVFFKLNLCFYALECKKTDEFNEYDWYTCTNLYNIYDFPLNDFPLFIHARERIKISESQYNDKLHKHYPQFKEFLKKEKEEKFYCFPKKKILRKPFSQSSTRKPFFIPDDPSETFFLQNVSKFNYSFVEKNFHSLPLEFLCEFFLRNPFYLSLIFSKIPDDYWKNDKFLKRLICCAPLEKIEKIFNEKNLYNDKDFIYRLGEKSLQSLIDKIHYEVAIDFDIMAKFLPFMPKLYLQTFGEFISQEKQSKFVKLFPYCFKHFKGFDDDKEIIIAAIEISNDSYYHASERLKSDRDVIMTLVAQYGLKAIEFPELLEEEDFARFSIESSPFVLKYLKKDFKNRKEFVSTCAVKIPLSLNYASDELKNDENFIFELCLKNREIFYQIKPEFKKLPKFIMMMEGKLFNLHPSNKIQLDIQFSFK
jgi:hypothetical protein